MEFSNLTICRQDVIVLSDTDADSNEVNSDKKKKRIRKTKCIRNVKLTTMAVKRIVPCCNRQRCRNGQHYHKQTCMNTKYRERKTASIQMKYAKREALAKDSLSKAGKNHDALTMVLNRDLYSPITVASSSDTYENISSCSFNILSSDSDELEDLINLTRKRMKNEVGNSCNLPLSKSICSTTIHDDYQNISSNDEVLDSSIHSMDTVVLYHDNTITSLPRNPEHVKKCNNNKIDPMSLCRGLNQGTKELLHQKIPDLSNQKNNNLSPLYEISGKVFMEHYLNTSFNMNI